MNISESVPHSCLPNWMEILTKFEDSLYGSDSENENIDIYDVEFWVDRICHLPSLRPFMKEKAVKYCIFYCKHPDFRQKLLEKALICPVLLFRLFQNGTYNFNEIEPILKGDDSDLLCYYFRREIANFNSFIQSKQNHINVDSQLIDEDLDQLIEFGFIQSSIEYCLKNDDISAFRCFRISNQRKAKWSPFEWSKRPIFLIFCLFLVFLDQLIVLDIY